MGLLKSNGKVLLLSIISMLLAVAIAVGISYAFWTQTEEQTTDNAFNTGCLSISLTEEENAINLRNAFAITDADGKKLTPYTFTVTNTCSMYVSYAINLEKLSGSTLGNDYVKAMIDEEIPKTFSGYDSATATIDGAEAKTLIVEGLPGGTLRSHSLRIWIDEKATVENSASKTFESKIVISATADEQKTYCTENPDSPLCKDMTQLAFDDADSNLRFIGANPNNYVKFNDETWRIIGVFNTYVCPDTTSGTLDTYSSTCKQEKLLKIIRNDFLSTSLAWDSSGYNNWNNASLQKALNGEYFGRTGTYASNGLKAAAQSMVANVVWTLGGTASYNSASNGLASHFYGYERGDTVSSGNPKAFVGHVGLMFPSDYGYATGGGTTYKRDACLQKEMYNWNGSSYKTDCAGGSWLYNFSTAQWTLSPYSGNSGGVFLVSSSGSVNGNNLAYHAYGVRPVVYLKSSVQILDDDMDGSSGKPYNLSL